MSSTIIKVLFITLLVLNTFSIPVFYPESINNNNQQFNKRNGLELNIGLDLNDIPAFGITTKTVPSDLMNEDSSSNISSSSSSSSISISNVISETSTKTVPDLTNSSTKTVPTTESTKTVPNVIIDSNDQQQLESSTKTIPNVIIDSNDQQQMESSNNMEVSSEESVVNVKTYYISITPPSPTPVPESMDNIASQSIQDDDDIHSEEENINAENVLDQAIENSDYEEEEFDAEIEHNCEQNDEECNDHILNSSDVELSNDEIDTSNVEMTTDTDSTIEVADVASLDDSIPSSEVPAPENSDTEEEINMNAMLVNDVDSADEQEDTDGLNLNVLPDETSSNILPSDTIQPVTIPSVPSVPSPSSPIEVSVPSDIPALPSINIPSTKELPESTINNTPSTPSTKELPESTTNNVLSTPEEKTENGSSTSDEKMNDGININDIPLLNGLGIDLPNLGEAHEELNENENANINEDNGFTVPKNINEGPIEAPDLKNSNDLTQSEYEDYLNDVDDNIKKLLSFESGENSEY